MTKADRTNRLRKRFQANGGLPSRAHTLPRTRVRSSRAHLTFAQYLDTLTHRTVSTTARSRTASSGTGVASTCTRAASGRNSFASSRTRTASAGNFIASGHTRVASGYTRATSSGNSFASDVKIIATAAIRIATGGRRSISRCAGPRESGKPPPRLRRSHPLRSLEGSFATRVRPTIA